jgi:hypothetical protein
MLVTEKQFEFPAEKTMWRISDCCFLCGEKLKQVPLIMWHGCRSAEASAEIWLHPKCAVHLATCLLMDNHKLRKMQESESEIPPQYRE